jgi:hypothetical protein
LYVCVRMAKRDTSPLMYRGFPTGVFTLKKKLNLANRGFPACGIGPSIQVPVTDYVTADDLYSVS